ncbi:hypothetical protein WDW37_06830 [Bdellovibrionota bacterium FG-1]
MIGALLQFPGFVWAGSPHDCICPHDETLLANPGTQSCGQIKCPACGHLMGRALYIGGRPQTVLAAQTLPGAPIDPAAAQPPHPAIVWAAATAPLSPAGAPGVTYTNTVAGIVEVNCARCHNGPLRNLATYENLKVYVDNGLLAALVRPGGPMNRFADKEANVIMEWTKNGAPK